MNNSIYNDIKNIYKFIFNNFIFFLIGFFFLLLTILLGLQFSHKIAYKEILIEFKFPNNYVEINKLYKYPLHINYNRHVETLNSQTQLSFYNSLHLSKNADPVIKTYVKNQIYSNNKYRTYRIDFNLSKPRKNLVMIIHMNFFVKSETILKNISEGIIDLVNDHKKVKYSYFSPKEKQIFNLVETDPSSISYILQTKHYIKYFNIFLIFLFIMFNVVSIIIIKEIKNDNIK